jgi:BCCT family betaine/carnitine transporter
MLIFGSLGCWVFYMIIGNYSMFLQLNDIVDVLATVKTVDGSAAIVATLESLPLAPAVITVFTLMSIIFAATTYDSASYTLASSATLHLSAGEDPARWHRVFWAFALAVMPITLLYVGGKDTITVMLLITSMPILIVGVFMSYALVKSLQHDIPE